MFPRRQTIGRIGGVSHHDRFAVHDHPAEPPDREGVPGVEPDRPVKSDQAGLGVKSEKKRRDIAVTDEHLGIGADEIIVEMRQHAGATPAALHGHDAGDFGVGELSREVGGAVLVLASEISVAVEEMVAEFDLEAQSLHVLFDEGHFEACGRRPRGADQGHGVPGFQSFRFDGFWHPHRRCFLRVRQLGNPGGKPRKSRGFQEISSVHLILPGLNSSSIFRCLALLRR